MLYKIIQDVWQNNRFHNQKLFNGYFPSHPVFNQAYFFKLSSVEFILDNN